MKLLDITYKLTDKAIMPDKMGVISKKLYDWTKYNYYENSIPEIEYIMHLCKGYRMETEIHNASGNEETPHGFYRKYVHFFIVEAEEETQITYFPRIAGDKNDKFRHWLNGKIVFIGHENMLYTVTLNKGYNIFCIEYGVLLSYCQTVPTVRIESINKSCGSLLSLTDQNYWFKPKDFLINVQSIFIQEDKIFAFSLIPLDLIHFDYNSKIKMLIKSEKTGKILFEAKLSFQKEYKIDLSFLPNMEEDKYNLLYAFFYAEDTCGQVSCKSIPLFRYYAAPDYLRELQEQAKELLKRNNIPELIKNEIHYYIDKLKTVDTDTYYGGNLKKILYAVQNNKIQEYLYHPGQHFYCYYSDEDKHFYQYYIVLPQNFDPEKEYSLLLTISHGYISDYPPEILESNYSNHFAERDDVICADIGGRGCTLGSYMGETFLLNEIKDILHRFRINKKRIYAVSHCAGNIALINLVQAFPHLFAGIYTRLTNAYRPNIDNLYNVRWFHLIASINENDPFLKERKQLEKALRNLHFLFVHKYYNADIELKRVQYTKRSIDLLMSEELNAYPDIIYYRTERNRCRKAYYIEIESILKGTSYAEVALEIVGYNMIIQAKNCTGLKIILPPQLDRENFFILINDKKLTFKKYYDNEVILKNTLTGGFIVSEDFCKSICHYKGTGLLDVYMTALRIVNCNTQDDMLKRVCDTFSHPKTNTDYPNILVDYPVIAVDEMQKNQNNALIIVDNNCDGSKEIHYIRSKLPIQMDGNGYTYMGKTVNGKYCIMQVIANPWHNEKSILYINTNDKSLYLRNLFTRSVIIPSYNSGCHPFLNQTALLYINNKFYAVSEWGDSFHEVKSQTAF